MKIVRKGEVRVEGKRAEESPCLEAGQSCARYAPHPRAPRRPLRR